MQDVADLWAMERSQVFDGLYHVLGNYSSSYLGINLEELEIDKIINKIERNEVKEIILALDATINGQTTANYIIEKLKNYQINFFIFGAWGACWWRIRLFRRWNDSRSF